MPRYQILSPDNFPISRTPFTSRKKALAYFEKWKEAFKIQGYYSTSNRERINPVDLDDCCSLVTI